MARIRYYTEALETCVVIRKNSYSRFEINLTKGVWFSYGGGHRTKKDAIEWCGKVNEAAGREVMRYHGPFDNSKCERLGQRDD